MEIDAHSVVYFINEEYGVVIRARGATREIAMWDKRKEGFTKRLEWSDAHFLVRHDRVNGKWCVAHPTYSLAKAVAAAKRLEPCLPGKDGMALAEAAKRTAIRAELREKDAAALSAELVENWKTREAGYAEK